LGGSTCVPQSSVGSAEGKIWRNNNAPIFAAQSIDKDGVIQSFSTTAELEKV
jgi:hypothetical protein